MHCGPRFIFLLKVRVINPFHLLLPAVTHRVLKVQCLLLHEVLPSHKWFHRLLVWFAVAVVHLREPKRLSLRTRIAKDFLKVLPVTMVPRRGKGSAVPGRDLHRFTVGVEVTSLEEVSILAKV